MESGSADRAKRFEGYPMDGGQLANALPGLSFPTLDTVAKMDGRAITSKAFLAQLGCWSCAGGEEKIMKVLITQDTFLPLLGGAEVHAWKLSKALSTRGHQITIVTATPGPQVIDELQVHRFPLLQSQGKKGIVALPFYLPKIVKKFSLVQEPAGFATNQNLRYS